MQMGFYFDQTRCTGCYTCTVACKDWHDVPAGPASWRRVITIEKGKFPNVFVAFLATSCYHCSQPACVSACPVGAITKREIDGIVVVNREECLGKDSCELCKLACPYEAPQFGAEENAKMQMCNLCLDRLAENKQPICVAGCPMRALDAGPIDELKAKHSDNKEAVGFAYSTKVVPSITLKAKEQPASIAWLAQQNSEEGQQELRRFNRKILFDIKNGESFSVDVKDERTSVVKGMPLEREGRLGAEGPKKYSES